jgi:hypothetical protein
MLATANVRQMVMVDFLQNSQLSIAARTVTGLHLWSVTGGPPATFLAPTAHPFGALTTFRAGGTQQLAWVALSNQTWRLRTLLGAQMEDRLITYPGLTDRFRLVGINTIPAAPGGTDELLVYQNTLPWHLRLSPFTLPTPFTVTSVIDSPGTTMNVDNCPSVCVDFNHDGIMDVATALTSLHCLQFQPTSAIAALGGGTVADDFLNSTCQMTASVAAGALDTLNLWVNAADFASMENLAVQVVAWPQPVGNPEAAPYNPGPMGAPTVNVLFPLKDLSPGTHPINMLQPVLPVRLRTSTAVAWRPEEQFFMMMRFVRCAGPIQAGTNPTVIWTHEPQMLGLVASEGQSPWGFVGYMNSVSTPTPPPVTTIMSAEPRNVGLLVKPRRAKTPASTVPVPAPGAATVVIPSQTQWQ